MRHLQWANSHRQKAECRLAGVVRERKMGSHLMGGLSVSQDEFWKLAAQQSECT